MAHLAASALRPAPGSANRCGRGSLCGGEDSTPSPNLRQRLRQGCCRRAAGCCTVVAQAAEGAEPDLSVAVNGMQLPNPFVIASGPPGANYAAMKEALEQGWGAVICKTVSLDSSKGRRVAPRYAQVHAQRPKAGAGWENVDPSGERPLKAMLADLRRLKQEHPGRILIASIMEEYRRGAWQELIGLCEETGVDGFEINFSCPHGMPERRMGLALGQDCELLAEVCQWVTRAAHVPVWAKLTPNVTEIAEPGGTALFSGCAGLSAINSIQSIMGIDLQTLHPEPGVEGYSPLGGYSSQAVRPIALAQVMALARLIRNGDGEDPDAFRSRSLSGVGGIATGEDGLEFLLLGADTVQVCTGVMLHGYGLVHALQEQLKAFMRRHGFQTIQDFKGLSLPCFSSHSELGQMQPDAQQHRQNHHVGHSSGNGKGRVVKERGPWSPTEGCHSVRGPWTPLREPGERYFPVCSFSA